MPLDFTSGRQKIRARSGELAKNKGTLIAFVDADGTCDPTYLGSLCRMALAESVDMVVATRLGADC